MWRGGPKRRGAIAAATLCGAAGGPSQGYTGRTLAGAGPKCRLGSCTLRQRQHCAFHSSALVHARMHAHPNRHSRAGRLLRGGRGRGLCPDGEEACGSMPIHRTVLTEYRTEHSRVVSGTCGQGVLSAQEARSARTGGSIEPQALEGLPGVRHVQPNHSEVGVPLVRVPSARPPGMSTLVTPSSARPPGMSTLLPPLPPTRPPARLCSFSPACTHPSLRVFAVGRVLTPQSHSGPRRRRRRRPFRIGSLSARA